MSDLLVELAEYYGTTFPSTCYSSSQPCGPTRLKLKGEEFRPPSLPAIGSEYESAKRRVLFLGIAPTSSKWESGYSADEVMHIYHDYFDPAAKANWKDVPFRLGLLRMGLIAHHGLCSSAKTRDDVMPLLAWSNIVKCGDEDIPGGQPNRHMWANCAPKIWGELKLLAPDLIISLGEAVHRELRQGAAHLGMEVELPEYPLSAFWCRIRIGSKSIGVYEAPHPSWPSKAAIAAATRLEKGNAPNQDWYSKLLQHVTGSDKAEDWRKAIAGEPEARPIVAESFLSFVDSQFIAPNARCSRLPSSGF